MKYKMIFIFIAILVSFSYFSAAQTTGLAHAVTYQPRPSFQAIYGAEDRLTTYWPILGDKDTCQARQDLLLQVSPVGCQPAVVRSDLLADQNVPVFCQIDALQINPLIDIDQIRSIRFSGKYPKEVIGAGFHPARAALRSRDKLLGSPLINNIGYVVVVLKRNPIEKDLPNSVSASLTAQLDYEAGNVFGVGKAEFLLEPMSDSEWEQEKFKDSFWEGRYFARLEEADSNFAVVSLYSGDRKIVTTRVKSGEISRTIWVPGAYCRAGVQVAYDGFVGAQNKAKIAISDDKGTEVFDVYEGSRFLNDRCSVDKINIDNNNLTGSVSIRCSERQNLKLSLNDAGKISSQKKLYLYKEHTGEGINELYLDLDRKEFSNINLEGKNVFLYGQKIGEVRDNTIFIDKNLFDKVLSGFSNEIKEKSKGFFDLLNEGRIERSEIILKQADKSGKELSEEAEKKFDESIEVLKKISDDYPSERERNVDGAKRWGELGLKRAIELSSLAGKDKIRAGLLREFIEKYPDSEFVNLYRYELTRISETDFSSAVGVINIDSRFKNIKLLDVSRPRKHSSADFSITGYEAENINVKLEELRNLSDKGVGSVDSLRLDKVDSEESARVSVNCRAEKNSNGAYNLKSFSYNLRLNADATKVCDKAYIRLKNLEIEEIAKVRLFPEAQGTRTETNLTVNIGIEKRAIKLSTSKTEELIENLNQSIKKWENINDKLGKIVTGLKSACFATSAVLTVKNFLTGISGEALARQKIMVGWTRTCTDLVSAGKYPTLSACYLAKRDEIDKDVNSAKEAINGINSRIEGIEKNYVEKSEGILGGESVDRSKSAVAYCEDLKNRYGERDVTVKSGTKKLKDVLGNCEQGYNNQGLYGYNELREMEYNLLIQEKAASDEVRQNSQKLLQSSYEQIESNKERFDEVEKAKRAKTLGLPSPIVATSSIRKNVVGEVVPASGVSSRVGIAGLKESSSTHLSSINVYDSQGTTINNVKREGFTGGTYLLGLAKDSEGYVVQEVFRKTGENSYEKLSPEKKSDFLDIYGIGRITSAESVSYVNPYKNPEVRYYETEPYKGMPAIVPIDIREGWYAATRQTLPAFGGIGAFDASGRVTSFYLCNVGPNGQEQFFEGYGDDICQLINLNTGQPLGFFPGLNEQEARRRVGQAVQAIQDAANQHGKKIVSINGKDFAVGNPAANLPATQCQNFMSPEECHLLFNVCDPVICPSSRCDFGGKFPVADVVQTGIIGSTLLCLPNIREGIVVPVCLTGIHAGIEGFLSILRNHRDCLQESLSTGRTVGICDQIYSVYLCEFFWRQVAPIAKVILPKIVELAYGQGTRGGGEYLTVMAAWQNMQNSIDYFTQSYAVNSIKAFRARSIEEAGTPFCKAFVSAKAPTSFKTLVEPDSPPQFHAWFSSIKFSDATVPATAQYKVFYHIFAGKDSGVYYSVYLRNPPESSYYTTPAVISVASGFVGRGQYATESRDFTAPEGYKELCVRVNDQEECGFKEVSTSFAVDYLRDSYVSEQAKESEIKSEGECISGSSSLAPLILSPNIQANAEEAALPKVYDRGIVRICSSNNPGSQTDPTRFVDKGYCDDQKIRCWLDKESVKNAITDNNKGLLNSTLSEIENGQRSDLAQKGIIVGDDIAVAEIKEIKESIDRLRAKSEITNQEVQESVKRLDALFNRVVLNHHKANILYMIGDVKAIVFEKIIQNKKIDENKKAANSEIPTVRTLNNEVNKVEENLLSLEKDYNPRERIYLLANGKKSDIYFEANKVKIDKIGFDSQVGSVVNDEIQLLKSFKDKINNEIKDASGVEKNYFEILNKAKINGNEIISAISTDNVAVGKDIFIQTPRIYSNSNYYNMQSASGKPYIKVPFGNQISLEFKNNCPEVEITSVFRALQVGSWNFKQEKDYAGEEITLLQDLNISKSGYYTIRIDCFDEKRESADVFRFVLDARE